MAEPLKIKAREEKLLAEKIKKAEASKSLPLETAMQISSEWKIRFK